MATIFYNASEGDPVPVDFDLAQNITRGCAYDGSYLYVSGKVYLNPAIREMGDLREVLLGDTIPAYVDIIYAGTIFLKANTTRLMTRKDILCVLKWKASL